MKTLRAGATGDEVLTLQNLLNQWGFACPLTGVFDENTEKAVCDFQQVQGLTADGIVGKRTWETLQDEARRQLVPFRLKETDYVRAAQYLNVEVAAIKAVQEVETGGRGGFIQIGYPTILFEGHIFWNQLKERGLNPEDYVAGNEDILYPNWTKKFYKQGMAEYDRLNRAKNINETAALCSASWGMWQIMGFNYAVCGCNTVFDFCTEMQLNEGTQLNLFTAFLRTNGWDKYLRDKNWSEFARHYNGPSYRENEYDKKLANAYEKYSI